MREPYSMSACAYGVARSWADTPAESSASSAQAHKPGGKKPGNSLPRLAPLLLTGEPSQPSYSRRGVIYTQVPVLAPALLLANGLQEG